MRRTNNYWFTNFLNENCFGFQSYRVRRTEVTRYIFNKESQTRQTYNDHGSEILSEENQQLLVSKDLESEPVIIGFQIYRMKRTGAIG